MLMNNLSIIVRYSHIFLNRKLQELDIGHAEQAILTYLIDKETVNQETIARHFMIDKGTIAKTLSRLEKKHYIKRFPNLKNQREKLVSLSEKGEEIINQMRSVLDNWNICLFEGIKQADKEKFIEVASVVALNATKVIGEEWSGGIGNDEK